jgi:hypothetical protein
VYKTNLIPNHWELYIYSTTRLNLFDTIDTLNPAIPKNDGIVIIPPSITALSCNLI